MPATLTDVPRDPDDERTCDTCDRTTNAGAWPDWRNGQCEGCDPSILEHA
jgi:hypothetical protein